jgi:mitosis inhibitor protein kinase SWE1
MAEIATNCEIPHNGLEWRQLRSGDFNSVLPSLTWSRDSSTLSRDANGEPISMNTSADAFLMSDSESSSAAAVHLQKFLDAEMAKAPSFMVDISDVHNLDFVVRSMMHPIPAERPTAEQVYQSFGCQWVAARRRSGATIYEGHFGPDPEVLEAFDDHPDAMDTS